MIVKQSPFEYLFAEMGHLECHGGNGDFGLGAGSEECKGMQYPWSM